MSTLREAAAKLIENCPCEDGCEICKPFKMALGIVETTCVWCSGVGTYYGEISGEPMQQPCAFCGGKGTFKQNAQQMALFIRLWAWGKWQDETEIECQVTVMCENFTQELKLKNETISQRDLVLAMLKQALKLVEKDSLISPARVQ
jgi:hypothetical protein